MAKKEESASGAAKKKAPAKKKAAAKKAPAKKAAAGKAAPAKAAATAAEVSFRLKAASAEWVSVVGTFNKWDPDKGGMKRDANGIWTKALKLKPGSYQYKFLVDGEWWADPENQDFCYNEHGTTNSILTVRK
jgi:1,4-alpha-glucan branching enzyme